MSKIRKKILASLSTEWAIRNFLHTGIIKKLSDKSSISIITNEEFRYIFETDDFKNFDIYYFDNQSEPISWKLVRQFKKKLQQKLLKSSTEDLWKKYVNRDLYQKIGGWVIENLVSNKLDYFLILLHFFLLK